MLRLNIYRYTVVLLICISGLSYSAKADTTCTALIDSAIVLSEQKAYMESFALLDKATNEARESKDYKNLFRAITNRAINYAEVSDHNNSLNYFLEAYRIALDHLDEHYELSSLNNIAGIYMQDTKYEQAKAYYTEVYNRLDGSTDSLFIGGSAINLVLSNALTKQHEEAEKYLQVAEKMLHSEPEKMLRVQSLSIALMRHRGELQTAIKDAKQLIEQLKKRPDSFLLCEVYIEIVRCYYELGEYDKALSYSHKALKHTSNLSDKVILYNLLAKASAPRGELSSALKYKELQVETYKELSSLNNKTQFEQSRIQFELQHNQKELTSSRTRLKYIKIIMLLAIILVVAIIWALILYVIQTKQRKLIIQLELEQEISAKQLLENRLNEKRNLMLLEQERVDATQNKLKQEIKLKNKELATQATYLSNRNEMIDKIEAAIAQIPSQEKNPKWALEIKRLKKEFKQKKEWSSFMTHFEKSNHRFITALKEKHPSLSVNEIRFLSFIYINIDLKEIAAMVNITPESCKRKRWLISQKLQLSSSSNLYEYLHSL